MNLHFAAFRRPMLSALFSASALLSAQTPAPQSTAVDPALLTKAASGDAAGEVTIGDAYAAGNGAPREPRQLAADYKQAAEWYRKAADQGNIRAEVHLGDFYRDGRGVTRSMEQATTWYRKAADQGDGGAQGTLGLLYSVGMGVSQDYVEAYYWLSLAAAEPGPNQARYASNRQSVGEHITTSDQAAVQDRVDAWKASHPRPPASK